MSGVELVLRIIAAMLLVGATAFVSYAIAARLLPRAPLVARAAATVVAGMWLASAGFHVLARLFIYTLPVALAALALATGAVLRFAHPRAAWRRDARALRCFARRLRRHPLAVAFGVCAAPVVARAVLVPPLGWDAVCYHSVKAAQWVQAHGLVYLSGPSAWAAYRNQLAGGEVFASWGMLPFHSYTFASLPDLAFWLGMGLAAWAVCRELLMREPFGTIAAAFVMCMPTARMAVGAGYVELPLVCVLGCALALTLRYLRRGEPGALVLAAAGYGIACATKANVLHLAAIGTAFLGARALFGRPRHIAAAAAALAAFAAVLAPWLVDNVRDTGFLLAHLPVKIAGIRLGEANDTVRWYLAWPNIVPYDWAKEVDAFRKLFPLDISAVQEGLGVVGLIPLLVCFAATPWLVARQRARGALVVLVVAGVIFSVYTRDFSMVRQYFARNSARFWLPAYVAAVPASLVWCGRAPRLGRVYGAFLVAVSLFHLIHLAVWGWGAYEKDGAFRVVAAGFAVGAAAFVLRETKWARAAVVAGAVAGLAWVGSYAYANRWQAVSQTTVLGDIPRFWIGGARKLDEPDRPKLVAFTAGPSQMPNQWLAYFFLGSRFQNRLVYVPVAADGRLRDYTPEDTLRPLTDRDAWVGRVRERGIDAIVTMPPAYVELQWLEASPADFDRIDGDRRTWGVYVPKKR